jgi:Cd2+/Zn2+-exporting ATPase
MELRPNEANVKRDGKIVTLPIEQIAIGDTIIVKPGERVGLDGVVAVGNSAVDQASITGESMPVDKVVGDAVFAGTMNTTGHLEVTVTKLAKDSTIARLIQMVEEAHSEKAETQRFIDDFEQYYAIGVILFTILAIIVPQIFGSELFATSFYRAMTILVAASPCALVISTPATVLSAIGNGAKRGILFKGGAYVENAATVKVVAFDKTGTLTMGEPEVTDIVPLAEEDADAVLQLAAAVEAKSQHPLAHAAVRAAEEKGLAILETAAFQAVTGKGVWGEVGDRFIHIGNMHYFAEHGGDALDKASVIVGHLQAQGKTSVVIAEIIEGNAHLLGVIAFADRVREDAKEIIDSLRKAGIEHVVMLTGDNKTVADTIAAHIGITAVYADLLPEDKVKAIKDVQARFGPTAMVGDGVNDAPALATADIGIAMGAAGSDVALETADIVLMSDDLHNISYLIGLSRKTRQTLLINIGFSLFMIALMITAILTVGLALPLAVFGHEGGTVLVSLNGMRMLTYKEK